MEQEKILSTLSEKLGETSFSPQTLQTYVELNPIAEGSEPDEAYWNKSSGFSERDARAIQPRCRNQS